MCQEVPCTFMHVHTVQGVILVAINFYQYVTRPVKTRLTYLHTNLASFFETLNYLNETLKICNYAHKALFVIHRDREM